jgi:hypothetical protein
MTENQSGWFVLFHITLGAVSGGSDAAGCRVIQIAAGLAHNRRKRLNFSPFPRLMCPGFPESGCQLLVMLRAGSKFVIDLGWACQR